MEKITIKGTLVFGFLLWYAADPARAQPPAFNPAVNPGQRPVISPWLNLNRAGTSTAVNYYGLVRPQFNAVNAQGQLQQEVNAAQQTANQGLQGVVDPNLPATGHRFGFGTHRRYFQNLGQGGAGGGLSPQGGVGPYGGTGLGNPLGNPLGNRGSLQNQGAGAAKR